ncbi:MAG: Nif3-like dinuclear metal center hexameric protein [Chromatiaceae bacterium]|jgi:dinuclear metal center YbgI/SA1388 family protein|nr:Nif3-like dinuclear metal center hexameric protein [Chromatiaceae bacterium]
MLEINTLRDYCEGLLACAEFEDYCPNGLQLEGDRPVRLLVSGVTASLALIDAAITQGADAILVHHGLFWKGEPSCLVGMRGRRVRALMRSGLSLYAYHLPLDAHPELGNNRQLAHVLGIVDAGPARTRGLVWRGRLRCHMDAVELASEVARVLKRQPLCVAAHERPIESLAWSTGAAQGFIEEAAGLGVDAYLSGEISEQTTHQARELGLSYFAAGHHATERYGVRALGAHLAERFGIEHRFLDIDNPV